MTPVSIEEARYAPGRLVLTALLFVMVAPVFWRQVEIREGSIAQAYENNRLYQQTYPSIAYSAARWREGRLPLWNSHQLCGTPFLADPANGVFQPINAIALLLPPERAMALHAYTCLALMGFFTALFARALGTSLTAAILGGVAYAFCGATAAGMSRPAIAATLAWTPCTFWALREYVRTWRLRTAALTGVALAMLLTAGSPAVAVAVLLLWIPYRFHLAFTAPARRRPRLARRAGGCAITGIVALALAAAQWAPTIVWLRTLDNPLDTLWRLDWAGLAAPGWREALTQFLMVKPDALPHMNYVGIATLLVAPAALFHKPARKDMALFLLAVPVFFFLASFEKLSMPFGYPQHALIVPAVFSVAVLAALGLDRIEMRAGPALPGVWRPALVVLACSAILFWASATDARGRVVMFVLLILLLLVIRTRLTIHLAALLVAALLFFDLALANANAYRHPFDDAPACYRTHVAAIGAAQEQAIGQRIFVSSHPLDIALSPNLGMLFPVHAAGGTHLPLSRDQVAWWRRLAPAEQRPQDGAAGTIEPSEVSAVLLDIMAVRAILSSKQGGLQDDAYKDETSALHSVQTDAQVRLLVNDNALPRAFCVSAWYGVESVNDAIDLMTQPDFDSTAACAIEVHSQGLVALKALLPETPPGSPVDTSGETAPGTCELLTDTPQRLVLHAHAPGPVIVVLADTYASGWRASVDGIPWPILKTNGLFRGVAIPAGPHEIVFEYRPTEFIVGAAAALSALALLALIGLVSLIRAK
ncbi:MAG TPA: YfhO family protein [Candidatus Hydrogenedentes bacterium]|nr:YfhO family protein [Candidatus Hydrogenedentota bacterium]HPG66017.1 YfhO family protein [Candidatus Hydrogenedentota bacterium]